ncbi:MAG: FAD-dependent oxidoreductase [Planctomycetia bacterium]|nr:FAD-dependent oxidoreductase [Planctomycetia bacterium]
MAQPGNRPGQASSVAIVGGGPGGLLTALFLQRSASRPITTTIFEASDRLGGKILTPSFAAAPVRYEAGAAELYDYTPVGEDPLRDLVAEFGLPTTPLGGTSLIIDGTPLSNLDDIAASLGAEARRELLAFDIRSRSGMTPREFYLSDDRLPVVSGTFTDTLARIRHPAVRRYVEMLIHSDLATEPALTSVSYGLQNYLMNDPAYMRLYAIAGGNDRLIEALVSRIDATKRLGTRVAHVGTGETQRLRITWQAGGETGATDFDAVVLALPLQHLAGVGFEKGRLAAAVQRHCEEHDHPAHYLRVTALFDEPFWRGSIDGSFAMLDAFGGCCLYDESSREPSPRHGVLGWLLGGEAAVAMAALDDETLVARVLDSLPAAFGDAGSRLIEARVHRWTGAVSGLPGGWRPRSLDRRHQPEPVAHPNLFVVGDYLFDSTLNGVLDSAAHVAGWLAAHGGE